MFSLKNKKYVSKLSTNISCIIPLLNFYMLVPDGWMDGWMDCNLTSFSTVFKSYQDDERLILKGKGAMEPHLWLRFRLKQGWNTESLDQQASN